MRMGIDCRMLTFQPTGVGRYLINLLEQFSQIPCEHYLIVYSRSYSCGSDFLQQPRFEQRVLVSPYLPNNRLVWEQLLLAKKAKSDQIDVFFCSGIYCPHPTYRLPECDYDL